MKLKKPYSYRDLAVSDTITAAKKCDYLAITVASN